MYKILLLFTSLLYSLIVSSQIGFEKGYFITNDGQQLTCYIKNEGWLYNPRFFKFKVSEDSEINKRDIDDVKEFGIYNSVVYKRFQVKIDRSEDNTYIKEPKLVNEILFLRIIVKGKATLYEFNDRKKKRFFYSIDDSHPEQLIHKTYFVDQSKLAQNNQFKQQFLINMKCDHIDNQQYYMLDYNRKDLMDVFIKYNNCEGSKNIVFQPIKKNEKIYIHIKPGLNLYSFEMISESNTDRNIKFNNEFDIKIGVEFEIIFPYNKNKWALFVEPSIHNYSSNIERGYNHISIKYYSIEIPVGLRYYVFLNNNIKLYFDLSMVGDINFNSKIDYHPYGKFDIRSIGNISLGTGFRYKDKLTLGICYHSTRDLLINYTDWNSKYNGISFVIGYSMLN